MPALTGRGCFFARCPRRKGSGRALLVLIAGELAAVHDEGLSGTVEQKCGGNYQDRYRASSLDSE